MSKSGSWMLGTADLLSGVRRALMTLRPAATGRPTGRASTLRSLSGAVAEWLRSGLQSRAHRFDSGRRLSFAPFTRERPAPRTAARAERPEASGDRLASAFRVALRRLRPAA